MFDVAAHARRAVFRTVAKAHFQRSETLVQIALGFFEEQVEVVVGVELGRVGPDLFLGPATEQFEHRLVDRFAHDVPDGDVDRRDRRHADAFAAPGVALAVHLLPDVFVVERVFANGDRCQVSVDDFLGHTRRQGAVTDADKTGVGLDFHHQPAVETERAHGVAALEQDVAGVGAEVRLRGDDFAFPLENAGTDRFDFHEYSSFTVNSVELSRVQAVRPDEVALF
ncbi:hypothetical protein D3C87_1071310 [compost metagenome]